MEGDNGVVSAGGVTTGEVSAGDSFLHDKMKNVDKNNRVKENILMDDITFFHDLSIIQLQCDDVAHSTDVFFCINFTNIAINCAKCSTISPAKNFQHEKG